MKDADGWESLTVRQLRAFVTVARLRSFSGGARELGYTQSAVSQQLLALERIVGATLLHRPRGGRRPVELTESGHGFLIHAEALLARALAARADLEAVALGEQGRLRIATIQSVGAKLLPDTLARYRAAHPGVHVEIREATSIRQLVAAVESGTVDVGFAVQPTPPGPLLTRELLDDPYVLVTTVDSHVHALRDLHGQRLLGIRGCKNDLLIEQNLLAEGIVPSTCERFDDNAMIQALAAAGEGVAVVPRLTIEPEDPRITVHLLRELPPRLVTAITHRERRLGPAAGRFIETATEVCAERAKLMRSTRAAA